MSISGCFLYKNRCQETYQDVTHDDRCYPIYQPLLPDIQLEMLLAQLRYKASCLRNQLAGVETQITQLEATAMTPWICYSSPRLRYQLVGMGTQIDQLAATVPSPGLGDSMPLFPAPPGLERGTISKPIASPFIARRKVINKKVTLATSDHKPVAKVVTSGNDGPVKCDPTDELGFRSIDHRTEDDSGIYSFSSDSDVCTVCGEEPTLHTCPSGCGSFCQPCYQAHLDDGRHWLT